MGALSRRSRTEKARIGWPRPLFSLLGATVLLGGGVNGGGVGQILFTGTVDTVSIYATVTDRTGRPVPDLPREAFRVRDNSTSVPLTVFASSVQPITAVTLLDMSDSMRGKYGRVRESMLAFVNGLHPEDRIRIGTFGTEVALSPYLTGDHAILTQVLTEELWPGGYTPLWRAMSLSMASLEVETGRRVLLVLTDGKDTSGHGLPGLPGGGGAVRRQATADAGIMIYAIGYADAAGSGLDRELIDLTRDTGGANVSVSPGADLTAAFVRIGEELRHQYVLGIPAAHDGRIHALDVRVEGPGLKVRSRASYVASTGR